MAGPWESFQPQLTVSVGPWTQYARAPYRPDPVSRAAIEAPPSPSFLRQVGTAVKEGTLPMAGAIGGGITGGVVASPTVAGTPVGVLVGEAAGSALGEALNQKLGLTYKSVMDKPGLDYKSIALSGAAPWMGRGLYAGGKALINQLPRAIPGAGAAFQEFGAAKAREALGWLKGRVGDTEKLFDVVEGYNPVIAVPKTMKTLQAKLEHYASNIPNVMEGEAPVQEVKKLAQGLLDEMQATGHMSFQKLRGAVKLMNESFGTTSGTLKNMYGELKDAIQQDLESAASRFTNQTAPQAVAALKAANASFKKKLAYDELKDVIEKKAIGERSGDMMTGFNRKAVIDALKKNETITKHLSPHELSALRMRMQALGTIPALPPAPGQAVGSSRTLMSGAIGGLGGFLSPVPGGAAMGTAAGPLAMEGMSKLAETELGKRILLRMAQAKGPKTGPDIAAYIAAWTSGSQP